MHGSDKGISFFMCGSRKNKKKKIYIYVFFGEKSVMTIWSSNASRIFGEPGCKQPKQQRLAQKDAKFNFSFVKF